MTRKVRRPKQTEPPGSPHARSREDMRWQGWRAPDCRHEDDEAARHAEQEADAMRLKWQGVLGKQSEKRLRKHGTPAGPKDTEVGRE